jgi:hypothetical protein
MQQQALYHTSNRYRQIERRVEGGNREQGAGGRGGRGGEGQLLLTKAAERKTYQHYLQPDTWKVSREGLTGWEQSERDERHVGILKKVNT